MDEAIKEIEKNPFDHILYEMEMYVRTYRFTVGDQFFTNLMKANHSVHLRNLTYFFSKGRKDENNWRYWEFMADRNLVQSLSGNQFKKFKQYRSGAVDHLNGNKMSDDYKQETEECEDEAFPVIVGRIIEFLDAMDAGAAEGREEDWGDPRIQDRAKYLREMCGTLVFGGGYVMSGSYRLHQVDAIGDAGDGYPARFYSLSDEGLEPVPRHWLS